MYLRMKSVLCVFVCLFVCVLCLVVWLMVVQVVDKLQQVYWVGFVYIVDVVVVQVIIFYVYVVLEWCGLVLLNQMLVQGFKCCVLVNLELIDQLVVMFDGIISVIVLVVVLDCELVLVELIGDQYKVLVEVVLQVLFFDFCECQVIVFYLFMLQCIDVQDY